MSGARCSSCLRYLKRFGSRLYSVSADKTGAVWDVEQLVRIRKLRDHTS